MGLSRQCVAHADDRERQNTGEIRARPVTRRAFHLGRAHRERDREEDPQEPRFQTARNGNAHDEHNPNEERQRIRERNADDLLTVSESDARCQGRPGEDDDRVSAAQRLAVHPYTLAPSDDGLHALARPSSGADSKS